jgi:negative regulator of sigma E activity
MHEKSFEPISAMMDGEIEAFELRRLIERTSNDGELKDKWGRYHLAQDIMQGRSVEMSDTVDLVSKVSAALETEPNYRTTVIHEVDQLVSKERPQQSPEEPSQWWKPMASMAMAASVTAVVLLGAQGYSTDTSVGPTVDLANVVKANEGFPQGKFGNQLSTVSSSNSQPVVKKMAYGMRQYIQQHRDLLANKAASWQANWLPQGFSKVTHRVSNKSEVLLY